MGKARKRGTGLAQAPARSKFLKRCIEMVARLTVVSIFLLSLLTGLNLSFGVQEKSDSEKILSMRLHPTMDQVMRVLGVPEHPNMVAVSDIEEYRPIARGIVQFERAFPGAVWAFLGRDSARAADAFEAFYLAIGQKNRVIRLNASGNSIDNATPEELWGFLKTNGILKRLKKNQPFIMADCTPYADDSQSRLLMNAAYAQLEKRGYPAKELMRKVNFINIGNTMPTRNVGVTTLMSKKTPSKGAPKEILTIGLEDFYHGSGWHDTFGMFKEKNGDVVAPPGALSDKATRQDMLGTMQKDLSVIVSPEFMRMVKAEAKKAGYPWQQIFKKNDPELFKIKNVQGSLREDLLKFIEDHKTPSQLELLENDSMEFSPKVEAEFLRLIPELAQQGYSLRQLKRLSMIFMPDGGRAEKYLGALSVLADSPKKYIDALTVFSAEDPSYTYSWSSKEINEDKLMKFAVDHLGTLKKKGGTVQDVIKLEKKIFGDDNAMKQKLLEKAFRLGFINSASDFLALARGTFEGSGAYGGNPDARSELLYKHLKEFFDSNPSLAQIKELFPHIYWETFALSATKRALKQAKTAKGYLTILSNAAAAVHENRHEMYPVDGFFAFAASTRHLEAMAELNPTRDELKKLKKVLIAYWRKVSPEEKSKKIEKSFLEIQERLFAPKGCKKNLQELGG